MAAAWPRMTGSTVTKEVEKKVELMKEVRAHEVAISELNSLHPSRAVYQKAGNIFFRKSVKSAVASEQKQLDLAKARLNKLDQA
ncbi:hypothetical protein ACP4OV_022305 [Aristida adscensionis]